MTRNNSEISFYVDTMIVSTLLEDGFTKQAQDSSVVSGLIDKVKHYVGNHVVDPNNKANSLLEILAPGVISWTFKAMGLGWLGLLFSLAVNIFHIDLGSILSSIYGKIKSMISGDKQVSSLDVDNAVQLSVQENVKPATEEEANQAAQLIEQKKSSQLLRDAKLLKLAMIEFDKNQMQKHAAPSFFASMFNSRKSTTVNLLIKVLGWIFKVALASAGLMVAGDVVNKFLDRPNALDDTLQKGKPITSPPTAAPASTVTAPTSTQTKFKVNPDYQNETKNVGNSNWIVNITNDKDSIDSMLIGFAKDVYQGLNGLENVIRNDPSFQHISDNIVFYNHASEGNPMVFIPKYFTSKKQIVDLFIDEVAKEAP